MPSAVAGRGNDSFNCCSCDSWEKDAGVRGPTQGDGRAAVGGSCWLGLSTANMGMSHGGSCVSVTSPSTPESATVDLSHLFISSLSAGSSVGAECLAVLLFRWPFLLRSSTFATACCLSGPSVSATPPSSERQTGWWWSSVVADKQGMRSVMVAAHSVCTSGGALLF